MPHPHDPLAWLDTHAARREEAGLRRCLTPRPPHDRLLDLASNDYLGLARDPRVVAGGAQALRPSAIVPVTIGEPDAAVQGARRCAERGLRVG